MRLKKSKVRIELTARLPYCTCSRLEHRYILPAQLNLPRTLTSFSTGRICPPTSHDVLSCPGHLRGTNATAGITVGVTCPPFYQLTFGYSYHIKPPRQADGTKLPDMALTIILSTNHAQASPCNQKGFGRSGQSYWLQEGAALRIEIKSQLSTRDNQNAIH